jgi:hypothetical protein
MKFALTTLALVTVLLAPGAYAGPPRAKSWPSGMEDALAYCKSGDAAVRFFMSGNRYLTDRECAHRFLKAYGPSKGQG